jgi:hypothetical protein
MHLAKPVLALALLLLFASSATAQDDLQGTVLTLQTDNYVVRSYGEQTAPVWEYWTKDDATSHYYVYLDSIYEVQWPAGTPPPNDNTYYTFQGANVTSGDYNYKPVTYKKDVNSEIYVKDLKWNISYPQEYPSGGGVPPPTLPPTISTQSALSTDGKQIVTQNVSYTVQQQAYFNVSATGYKNGTAVPFSWLQFRIYLQKPDTKCKVECYVYDYKWKSPNAYLVVNYKVWYNNAPVSNYGTSYPYTVWSNKGYFNSNGYAYQWTKSATDAPTAAPGPAIDPNYLYYNVVPGNNISCVGGYDSKIQRYSILYGHYPDSYYHNYSFGVYPVAPTTLPPVTTVPATTQPYPQQQVNAATGMGVAFIMLAALTLLVGWM